LGTLSIPYQEQDMTLHTPKVTIGVLVYNGDNYLAEALESIMAQTFTDFEVVISDNGSTDGSADICRSFARRDRRIRYYRHEKNRGAAWNHNRALELARGEYFKWLAHDDAIEPEYLAECVKLLDAEPDVAWCQSQVILIDHVGRRLRGNINAWNRPGAPATEIHSVQAFDPGEWRGDRGHERPSVRFAAVLLGAAWCLDGYGMMRTNMLRQTRGYLPTYGSEKIVVGELSLRGRYAEIPRPLKLVRIHESSSGSLGQTAQQQSFMGARHARRWLHPRLQLVWDQLAGVRRAPLTFGERLRCAIVVARYLLQFHKWGSVLRSLVSRRGTGGANEIFLQECSLADVEPARPAPASRTEAMVS
jgi:hypothetical protein